MAPTGIAKVNAQNAIQKEAARKFCEDQLIDKFIKSVSMIERYGFSETTTTVRCSPTVITTVIGNTARASGVVTKAFWPES